MKSHDARKRWLFSAVMAAAFLAFTVRSAHAQWTQRQELTASDGTYSDYFGAGVAVSGDVAVFGAYLDDTAAGVDAGSVYVFELQGGQWVQQQALTASDGAANDHFGISVALRGNVLVVGAANADTTGGSDAGAAYVFRFNGAQWLEEAKITASDGVGGDQFGRSVAAADDVIAVGAPYDDTPAGLDVGSLYVYRYKGALLLWQEEQKLSASDGAAYDGLGTAMAMVDHDTVLVGAYAHDTAAAYDGGAVYQFEYDRGSWTQTQIVVASDAAHYDQFGYSLAVEDDVLVVGAVSDDAPNVDSGSAYMFRKLAGSWVQQAKLVPETAANYDYFGSAVALHDETVLVGAPRRDEVFADSGAAYLFRYAGPNCGWVEQRPEFVGKDRGYSDYLGSACALTSDSALVGAYLKDTSGGYDAGAVYVFDVQEFLLTIDPTTVTAGQKITFDSHFGMPNEPVMVIVRDINGVPFFNILLIGRFSANYNWAFAANVPSGLAGLNVTFQSFKETDPCRGKAVGTNQVVVHFQ